MAYATIAGLPVEVGLYTCMLPMLVYALLGGSRSLSISTTSTIAILAASALSTLPSSRVEDDLLRDAFTLTTLVGLCLLAMRLFRLGSLVEQISPATLSGVKAGVGLTVAATQLPALLGVSGDKQDEGFFGKVADALSKLGDANAATVCRLGRIDRRAARASPSGPAGPRTTGRGCRRHPARGSDRHRGARSLGHRRGPLGTADARRCPCSTTSAPCCPERWRSR